MDIQDEVIQWLLDENNPSLRFRTLKELLGFDEDSPEVRKAKSAISTSPPVIDLLNRMHPDGYWLQKTSRQILVGEDVMYGSFGSTHFCLSYLAELGLDRTHPLVAKAADRYLGLQQPDGDWLGHYSCLLGYNIRTFVLLGYRNDPRVQLAFDLMLQTKRDDGGYLCDMHEGKLKTRMCKSCVRGSAKCLMAFMELPEYWDHPRCKQLVDYFLRRGGIFQSTHPGILVNYDMERMSYPITWRTNVYEVLLGLGRMGYGGDDRLKKAWEVLEARADEAGRYHLDWTPTQSPWKVGQRGEANGWVTFYALLARKYRTQTLNRSR
jgi:hypothetical protein